MKKYILLIVVSLSFVACKKKSTIHITAKNIVTGEVYPGLKYSIVRSKTGLFENHYKTVASGTLNENGEAYITKYFAKNWSHDLNIENPENACYSKKDHYYFSGGENVEANFEYAECGYMKLDIHNVNCQGQSDLIKFRRTSVYDNNDFIIKEGCFNYLGNYFSLPEGEYEYEWYVTKNGNTSYYDSTFFINKNEHYTFIINY